MFYDVIKLIVNRIFLASLIILGTIALIAYGIGVMVGAHHV